MKSFLEALSKAPKEKERRGKHFIVERKSNFRIIQFTTLAQLYENLLSQHLSQHCGGDDDVTVV